MISMKNEETNKDEVPADSEAASAQPSPGQEFVKDREQGEDELIDNMPDSHPEPRPSEKS